MKERFTVKPTAEEQHKIVCETREEESDAITKTFSEWIDKKVEMTGLPSLCFVIGVSHALLIKGHELACCLHGPGIDKAAAENELQKLMDWHTCQLISMIERKHDDGGFDFVITPDSDE